MCQTRPYQLFLADGDAKAGSLVLVYLLKFSPSLVVLHDPSLFEILSALTPSLPRKTGTAATNLASIDFSGFLLQFEFFPPEIPPQQKTILHTFTFGQNGLGPVFESQEERGQLDSGCDFLEWVLPSS
jgi:hypothetical protein